MAQKDRIVNLALTYCPFCHLATRADRERCLHCGRVRKPLAAPGLPNPRAGHGNHGSTIVAGERLNG